MKKTDFIELDNNMNSSKKTDTSAVGANLRELVNSLKFYYFGRAYSIMNSKKKNRKKFFTMCELRDELRNDRFLHLSKVLEEIADEIDSVLLDKLYELQDRNRLYKFKIPRRFSLFKSVRTGR